MSWTVRAQVDTTLSSGFNTFDRFQTRRSSMVPYGCPMKRSGKILRWFLSAAAATGICLAQPSAAKAATENPFELLVGKWGGKGIMTLEGGRKQRLTCDANYSGGASQLTMAINCRGGENEVKLQAKLSVNAGRLLGIWEEKVNRVAGSISGIATKNRVSFTIVGVVQGTMIVAYSKARQKVEITARGIPLQTVSMTMTRR